MIHRPSRLGTRHGVVAFIIHANRLMINLNEFVTFCAIADTGSFSLAAEKLQISKALVSKHLLDLEQSLGVKLMHRTTRKVGLTAA